MTKYRLSWEMVSTVHLSKYCNADPMYYSNTTQTVPNSQIPDEDWHRIEKVVDTLEEVEGQYSTLKEWDASDKEFVRNIKLERAVVPEPQWEEIDG